MGTRHFEGSVFLKERGNFQNKESTSLLIAISLGVRASSAPLFPCYDFKIEIQRHCSVPKSREPPSVQRRINVVVAAQGSDVFMCSVFAWSTLATLQKIAFSEDSSSLLTLSPDELKRRMNVFDGNIEPSLKKRAISKTNGDDEADEKTFRPIFGSACPPNKKVYLDYNATTPLEPSVLDAIFYSLKYAWGNPSSSYSEGKMAKNVIDESRNHVARMINRGSNEIVFTSGGTEANNMVFHSVIQNFQGHENSHKCQDSKDKVKLMNSCNPCPHIVTCNIEHDSVVLALRALKSQGKVEVTEVPVSKETGQVPVNDVIAVIQRNTVLVSFMLANNETGVIQVCEIQVYLYFDSFEKSHTNCAG